MKKNYDYIIIGAGAAGLQLALRFVEDDFFADKHILLIDKSEKDANDRTWCFWEEGKGRWDGILNHSWTRARIGGNGGYHTINMAPYGYKMLRGSDFYNYALDKVQKSSNVEFVQTNVLKVIEVNEHVEVQTSHARYQAAYCFDSRVDVFRYSEKQIPVWQHFAGWFIKTEEPVFNPSVVDFMDFNIPQKGNTRFMYVLPTSSTKALLEYTLFSPDLLKDSEYEEGILEYLKDKGITRYEIVEKEAGCIPMTVYPFERESSDRIIRIGTAGGWTKASTGFTFRPTERKIDKLISQLKAGAPNAKKLINKRHRFYDSLLLSILKKDNQLGSHIFTQMLTKASPQLALKFLDEETTLWEDIQVIWKCPKWPFMKSLFRKLLSIN